jgi:hypothetical protein
MIGAFIVLARGGPASAQTQSEVSVTVTPYMWFPGLEGDIGMGTVAANANLSAWRAVSSLRFALMASAELRTQRWVTSVDVTHRSLDDAKVTLLRGDSGTTWLSQHQTIVQPVAGVTLGGATWATDFLAGARYWYVSNDLLVDRGPAGSAMRSASRNWLDATVGARFHWMPGYGVRIEGAGDVGGGGSQNTWQAQGSLGKDIGHWTPAVAYRFLSVDYDRDGFLYDTDQHGIVVAVTYRF